MIDPFSNPQNKLQQQSNAQVTQGQQTKLAPEAPGQPSSTLPPGQPTAAPIPTDQLTPEQAQEAQEQQAQDKKGFKQALQDAKARVIDKGKQYLQDRATSAINSYIQPQQEGQDMPGQQVKPTPQDSRPTPNPPTPSRPDTSNMPRPTPPAARKPPQPRAPKMQRPPRPRMK